MQLSLTLPQDVQLFEPIDRRTMALSPIAVLEAGSCLEVGDFDTVKWEGSYVLALKLLPQGRARILLQEISADTRFPANAWSFLYHRGLSIYQEGFPEKRDGEFRALTTEMRVLEHRLLISVIQLSERSLRIVR